MDSELSFQREYKDLSESLTTTELAQIGKQLGDTTRLHIGNVYITNLEDVRTKRHEITLTRDLEFVRIHDTVTGRVLASYPDAAPYFHMCTPHCVLIRQRQGRTQRILWQAIGNKELHHSTDSLSTTAVSKALAMKDSAEGSWLRCKVDWVDQDGSSIPEEHQPGSVPTIGLVASLESIILHGNVFLLAAYENGLLACYTEDLKTASSPLAESMMGETIKFMTTISSTKAKDGILQSVANIHAMLDGSRLLVLVSQLPLAGESHQLRIRVIQLSVKPSDPNRPMGTTLFTRDEKLDQGLQNNISCLVHEKGQLYVWGNKTIQVFDFRDSSTEASKKIRPTHTVISVVRLDQDSMAVLTTHGLEHVNHRQSTTYASIAWPQRVQQSSITKQYESQLINYQRKSRQVLFLHDHKLQSITLHRTDAWTLADFIDRGLGQGDITANFSSTMHDSHIARNPRGDATWAEWTALRISLHEHVQENDIGAFDALFKRLLEFIVDHAIDDFGKITLTPSQELQNDEKLSTIICSILEPAYVDDESPSLNLKIKIHPKKTFQWLSRSGYFSTTRIEHAFRRIGIVRTSAHLRDTAIIRAIFGVDDTLSILHSFVLNSRTLTATQAACAIGIAMSSRLALRKAAIESGTAMEIDDAQTGLLPNNSSVSALPNDNNDSASAMIRNTMLRLMAYTREVRTSALRSQLSPQQLFELVNFLRIEMGSQGWFVNVLQDVDTNSDDGPTQHSMTRLVSILNSILDALGMMPWLNSSATDQAEELMSWMRLETSAALEAVVEANYTAGILHEAGLFTKKLNVEQESTKPEYGRIEPVTMIDGLPGHNALPIGLQPAGYIDVNVVKDGKVQRMSQRQIGHMKSKLVGAYSRERINLDDFVPEPVTQERKKRKL